MRFRFWQGHDPGDLLLCLIAAIFVICLGLGALNLSCVDRTILVRP